MRILIIDDTAANREKAAQQLQGHELVFASSYDEAQAALLPTLDRDAHEQRKVELMAAAGFTRDCEPYRGTDKWDAYWTANRVASKQATGELTVHPRFDAVLSDLMLPASKQALGPDGCQYIGKEMPLGTFLVLLAMKAGITKIGLVTDMNHHNHPASAALDVFRPRWKGPFDVGGTKVVCWNEGKQWDQVLGLLNGDKPE